MAKFDSFKENKNKLKKQYVKALNYISSLKVTIHNEEKLFDESIDGYISIDFVFETPIASPSTSEIYNYIAEYANKHSIKIVTISNIIRLEDSKYANTSVIFKKYSNIG